MDHTLQYILIDRFCLVGSPIMAKRVDEPGKRDRQDCDVTWNEKADERAFVNKLIAAWRERAGSHLRKVQRAQEHKLGQESVNSPKRRAPRVGSVAISDSSPRPRPQPPLADLFHLLVESN